MEFKSFTVVVRSKCRVTIPTECWKAAGCTEKHLELRINGNRYWWSNGVGLTKNKSYCITIPFFKEGTTLELIPIVEDENDRNKQYIQVIEI